MADARVRFGIMGCAEIARKVSRAIMLAPNAELSAVASRTAEKAAAFAKANNFPAKAKIFSSYESLLEDPEIDVIYVPVPTSLHVKWACLAAQNKKHVLLEKPVALNLADFDKIAAACEENGVQFMDGTMWMHHPRTEKMRQFLNDKERFGQLKVIHSCFTFAGDENFLKNDVRVKPDLDGLGCLGDAGWYPIRAILWTTDYELPKTVVALREPVLNEAGVVMSCGASLHWEDGKIATFYCSFLSHLTAYVNAIGTHGTLHFDDFIIPFKEEQCSYTTSTKAWFTDLQRGIVPLPSQDTVTADLPQEVCMVKELAYLVGNIKAGGRPDPTWPTRSRKTQLILDAVKASIENGFEPVKVVG